MFHKWSLSDYVLKILEKFFNFFYSLHTFLRFHHKIYGHKSFDIKNKKSYLDIFEPE